MVTTCWATIMAGVFLVSSGEENFKPVKPIVYEREKKEVPDIWALDFTFRNPRYIMVNVPGKGTKLVWYMTYKIVNRTGESRVFYPSFELVTDKGTIHRDVIMPAAEEKVTMREDPMSPLLNAVRISSPIPHTPKEGAPIVRRGVVFWEDVDMKTKSFTVFITGLSNGYHKIDDPANKGKEKFLRKTLKLDFIKPGDDINPNELEIKFSGEPTWIYR